MKAYKPVFWPVPVFVRDELKPTKRGKRDASNYGLCIVASRDTVQNRPWILEQEKYESRYWTLRGFGLWYLFCRLFYPVGLCRVECQSRAQEIRAKRHLLDEPDGYALERDWIILVARDYARSIHNAQNYPFFKAAGWSEEDVYNEIIKWL